MRTSNKILLGFALVILGTATALALNLRYRIDHHSYTRKLTGDEVRRDVAISLGHITRIRVDGTASITVSHAAEDSIWLFPANPGFTYRVTGDTLVIMGNPQGVSISASHLNEVELKGNGNCNITGFKGDSLFIYAANGYNVDLDSLGVPDLHLRGYGEISLSNSTCERLSLDSTTNFHAEQDQIGSFKKQ